MKPSVVAGAALFVMMVAPTIALGHSPYAKALKTHYELRSVSCYACHAKGKDKKTGKSLGKEHLNSFGKAQAALLKDKKVKQRLEDVKKSSREEREKVNEAVAAEFLKVMAKIEKQPAADKKTWLELLKSGKLEGIRLKS